MKVKIYQREYDIPEFNNQQIQALERQIQAAWQVVQTSYVHKPTFFQRLFGYISPSSSMVNQPKITPSFSNIDERFQALNQVIDHYDELIVLLRQHKNLFEEIFNAAMQDVQAVLRQKCLEIITLEEDRLKSEQTWRALGDDERAAEIITEREDYLNLVKMLGQGAVLTLKKLELFKTALSELTTNQTQKQLAWEKLVQVTEQYQKDYERKKRTEQLRSEIKDVLQQALNLEELLKPYLGPFQVLIEQVSQTDTQLAREVRDIQFLVADILNNNNAKLTLGDQSEQGFIEFLMHSQLGQDKLTDMLQAADWLTLSGAEQVTAGVSVREAVQNLQTFIDVRFPQLIVVSVTEQERVRRQEKIICASLPSVVCEKLDNGMVLEMVLIPAGEFMMGENDSDCEKPLHKVRIKQPFYMGKYPVTQAQWLAVMGNYPSRFSGNPNLPVKGVNWNDCVVFCKKLSQVTGKTYRLPSEAEWEYACRANSQTKYWWGNEMDDSRCWYGKNSRKRTHQVNEKVNEHTNGFGLCDMLGNVWEWCADDWERNYNKSRTQNPYKNQANERVLRGGSGYNDSGDVRSATRIDYNVANRNRYVGFRLVFSPQD